jgi:tryptophan-rich sensory protein
MPTLDVAMPIALFVVVAVAMFLNRKVEGKLMATVEERQFKTRDIILLVVFMAIVISVIAYSSLVAPEQVFQRVFLLIFLASYTMLLFTFSYIFSNLTKKRAQLISLGFGSVSAIAGAVSLLGPLSDSFTVYRTIAFFSLAIFCFGTIILE